MSLKISKEKIGIMTSAKEIISFEFMYKKITSIIKESLDCYGNDPATYRRSQTHGEWES